jgi:hypothetical protein
MTARILDNRHWRAAQRRRACRDRSSVQAAPASRAMLADILRPVHPDGGDAA